MRAEEEAEPVRPAAGVRSEANGAIRELAWMECDACGGALKIMGHCKYLCQRCGFLRTCMDTV